MTKQEQMDIKKMNLGKQVFLISLSFITTFSFAWDPVKDLTGKSLHEHVEDVGESLPNCGGDICGAAEHVKNEAKKTVEKGAKEAGNFVDDTVKTVTTGKPHGDIAKTLVKAIDDTIKEADRGLKNVEETVHAIGKFTERHMHGVGETLSDAEKRAREGKVVDAIWHLGTDPLRHIENNAAIAAQESSIINTVGQVAATAYGGPGGAAAYAAWYTYKETGDADLAIKVGIITGATSTAFGAVGDIPSNTAGELTKKTLVTGAIGGVAVAASGGDEAAIREGFLRSGGMVLVQDGYRRVTTHELDARASRGEAYCMTTIGEDCSPPNEAYIRDEAGNIQLDREGKPLVDILKTDPRRPHVGNWSSYKEANWNHERGAFMTSVSRIPGMNAMSVFHDQWAITWDINTLQSQATIAPAVVLTYIGTGAPAYDLVQKTNTRTHGKNAEADAGQIGLHTLNHIELADVTEQEKISSSVAASFICTNSGLPRQIVLEAPSAHPNYACRVIYSSEKGLSVPWQAKDEVNYCEPKAIEFVAKHIDWGWSCFGQ
ncbi:hypothetical protein [Halomonas sp. LES1]|uniref:hypothetical protein n=1 Tax=Halomonas sp. LES1 TaxID=3075513 RepID=UPI002887B6CD|nr:hypothetical protein [Halomonas sp. LES1]MDT0513414.1 hypothetical protein [Halomonas sp. LES1]